MSLSFNVYFAGELFDHKDLIGNALIASQIEGLSKKRYRCILPQNTELPTGRTADIRNQDFRLVLECDLGIFHFDGTDLDSGTVVEFMVAKFLDIPAVVVRSDFRSSGDQGTHGNSWNLMCSFYPRTEIIRFNAMQWYREAFGQAHGVIEATENLCSKIANRIIRALDTVREQPPLLHNDQDRLKELYRWALIFPGGGLESAFSSSIDIDTIVAAKIKKGVA